MPSLEHELLVELFRNDTRLLHDLLRSAFDLTLPGKEAKPVEASLNQAIPAEARADLVLSFGEELRVIVEVQLGKDKEKERVWPNYVTSLNLRDSCKALLVVVTPSEAVARWARGPHDTGHPGFTFQPLVLGPGSLPLITELRTAHEKPALTLLAALLRGPAPPGGEIEAGKAALVAAAGLDSPLSTVYSDLVLRSLGPIAQQVLEAAMSISPFDYEYKSEFALKYIAIGREEGREEGREKGREEGREEGRGVIAQAILRVLDAREISLSDEDRSRIQQCSDLSVLQTWLERSLSATTTSDLFTPRE